MKDNNASIAKRYRALCGRSRVPTKGQLNLTQCCKS